MSFNDQIKSACIIDDDAIYVKLIKHVIKTKKLCSNLLVFNNGQQSLDYFKNQTEDLNSSNQIPEIIFLDINMPIMDGWEFLEHFTKIKNKFHKKITIYIVSSSINPVDLERAKKLSSVTDYLIKPISLSRLETLFK